MIFQIVTPIFEWSVGNLNQSISKKGIISVLLIKSLQRYEKWNCKDANVKYILQTLSYISQKTDPM